MSIATEIQRLKNAKANLKTAIEGKGVTVPANSTIDSYPTLINEIITATPAVVEPLNVSVNGTYTPTAGVDGFAPVNVNVSGVSVDLFDVAYSIELTDTVTELTIPFLRTGPYIVVLSPALTAAEISALGYTVLDASAFIIYQSGGQPDIRDGVSGYIRLNGTYGYYGTRVVFANDTRTNITFKPDANGALKMLAGHTINVLIPKTGSN